jgi:hypothetical protein
MIGYYFYCGTMIGQYIIIRFRNYYSNLVEI